jgi:hypothetical protein
MGGAASGNIVPKRPRGPSGSKEEVFAGEERYGDAARKARVRGGAGIRNLWSSLRRRVGGRRLLRGWLAVGVGPDRMGSVPLRKLSGPARGDRFPHRAVGPGLPVRPARVDLPGVRASRVAGSQSQSGGAQESQAHAGQARQRGDGWNYSATDRPRRRGFRGRNARSHGQGARGERGFSQRSARPRDRLPRRVRDSH